MAKALGMQKIWYVAFDRNYVWHTALCSQKSPCSVKCFSMLGQYIALARSSTFLYRKNL